MFKLLKKKREITKEEQETTALLLENQRKADIFLAEAYSILASKSCKSINSAISLILFKFVHGGSMPEGVESLIGSKVLFRVYRDIGKIYGHVTIHGMKFTEKSLGVYRYNCNSDWASAWVDKFCKLKQNKLHHKGSYKRIIRERFDVLKQQYQL
jgi:hypothetical protein